MTFSEQVKHELCAISADKPCCASAELYGLLLFGHTFTRGLVKLVTKYQVIANRVQALCQQLLGLSMEVRQLAGGKLSLSLSDSEKLAKLLDWYGYGHTIDIALHINNGILEDECCRGAFLRGAFLAAGAVNRPKAVEDYAPSQEKFHLEFAGPHYYVMREFASLLRDMDMKPHMVSRKGEYVVYFKAAEAIGEVLARAGATSAYMEVLMAQMERQLRNDVNRKVNCETGNLTRVVEAASAQCEAIERLRADGRFEQLSEALKQTAEVRAENPEWSLSELAAALAVSKSALNHRLRKIVAFSRERRAP